MQKDYGTDDASCGVCTDNDCSWDDHECTPYRLVMYQDTVTRTYADIEENGTFKQAGDDNSIVFRLNQLEPLDKTDCADLIESFLQFGEKLRMSLNRLREIAGDSNPCSQEEFNEYLIENEKRERSLG